MWGSDYPHGDGVWPESSKYIDEQFGHLPADVTHKITCENAGKFYGLVFGPRNPVTDQSATKPAEAVSTPAWPGTRQTLREARRRSRRSWRMS